MAKKKNAPILRAQGGGGEQPATKTITKSYAVRDKWLDKAKDNLVEFKSVDGEISDLKVNGEPAGGGGGSSLVSVTIINNLNYSILPDNYNVSTILMDMSDPWELPAGTVKYPKEMWEGPSIAAGNRYTVQNIVLVGDGNALITFNISDATYTATGSITRVNDYQYGSAFIVTGPGTITVS